MKTVDTAGSLMMKEKCCRGEQLLSSVMMEHSDKKMSNFLCYIVGSGGTTCFPSRRDLIQRRSLIYEGAKVAQPETDRRNDFFSSYEAKKKLFQLKD